MVVLDTNVVSEAMKPEPHPSVRAWLNEQAAETLYISSVTLAELLFGIGAMWGFPIPDGYIAAIAVSHGFKVASRDMAPFEAANVDLINPWEWDTVR